YQRSSPVGDGQPLFPLAFCRECGQDILVVNLDKGGENFSPRILNGARGEQAEATGLLLVTEKPWPSPNDPALLDLVPEDWVVETGTRWPVSNGVVCGLGSAGSIVRRVGRSIVCGPACVAGFAFSVPTTSCECPRRSDVVA
ncbi:MAG: hypothetical protein QOC63_1082, partial [Mycobacterium sp.]|nr:hypothetical protein [Mycobacterium sp.]